MIDFFPLSLDFLFNPDTKYTLHPFPHPLTCPRPPPWPWPFLGQLAQEVWPVLYIDTYKLAHMVHKKIDLPEKSEVFIRSGLYCEKKVGRALANDIYINIHILL